MTPRYNNKELLTHCRSQEKKVLEKAHSSISDSFLINIKTDDDFIPERQIILGTSDTFKIDSSEEEIPLEKLQELLSSNIPIIYNIKTKLGNLSLDSVRQANLTRDLVKGYQIGQNELDNLNKRFPSIYNNIRKLKSATEDQLEMRILSSVNHSAILQDSLDEYEKKLSNDFSAKLTSAIIKRIATEAISDWLGRCPLDFPPLNGGAK